MSRGVRSMNGINNIEVNNIEFPDGSTISSASNLVQLDTNNNFTGNNTFNVNLPTSTKTPLVGDINNNTMLNKASADLLYTQTDENDYPTNFTRNGTTGVITLTTADTGTPLSGDTSITSITDGQILAIGTNTSAISTNTSTIAIHTTDIADNSTDIADNTTAIATNTTAIATNTSAIATINSTLVSIQAQISAIPTFNPANNITFSGNNTFTGNNTFGGQDKFTQFNQALIEDNVVQIVSHHNKVANITNSNGNTDAAGEYYTNMGKSPTLFKCKIKPVSANSYIRVSVVASYSINPFMLNGQGSWWSGVRLYRTFGDGTSANLTELQDANNSRSATRGTATSIGNCWITDTTGASTLASNTWNSNFIRQVSGIYIDTSVILNSADEVEYSIAIRGNTTQASPVPNQNQQIIAFNQGYNGVGSGRPASTSYIQLEEIYKE